MAIPEGYEKLAVVGMAWKGDYAASTAYKIMNAVYYEGSTYVALRDNPTGPPAADGTNWQYLAKGFVAALLSMITATDTSGIMGTAGADVGAQALVDAIARKVATELVSNSALATQLAGYVAKSAIVQTESTRADMVPSSAYFKQTFDTLNSNLESLNNISKTTLIYRGQITGDLNNTSIVTGFYRIEANNSVINAPSGCSYCILVAFGPPHFVQMVIDTTGIRVRKRTGNPPAWGIWAVI